ncbi:MAG: L-threonylcarbamoyladenylate synthase [Polyangiales bacterium]
MGAATSRDRVLPATPDAIARAGEILRAGGLVAIPTETVYGLAAHALDPEAVKRIFAAKGRPSNNPLIVHVADLPSARALASVWPAAADRLAEAFWPGPLTVVVPRHAGIPDEVTAGGPTVAIRIPSHPVARAILAEARVPLAAPSANRSNAVSPTTARHVLDSLGDRIDLVIDGGPCEGGIESTVLDLAHDPPTLLRPGLITPAQIEAVIGPIARHRELGPQLPSPGLLAKHYSPRAKLEIADRTRALELVERGERVAFVAFADPVDGATNVLMPQDPGAYASRLYATLHDLDSQGISIIVVALLPADEAWLGVRDRLSRAAS